MVILFLLMLLRICMCTFAQGEFSLPSCIHVRQLCFPLWRGNAGGILMTVRPLAMVTKVGRRVLVALGEVLVLGKVLVLVRVRLAKVRVVICGSVVIALGKVLVIGSLGILTLRPLAKVVILALQSLQRRRRKRNNNEQLTLGKIRRTRGQLISKEKEFRPLAMVRRTQPGAENAAGDGWNKNCQRRRRRRQ